MSPAIWETNPQPQKQNVELAICIPHKGSFSSEWFVAFETLAKPPQTMLFVDKFLPLEHSRNLLVRSALSAGAKRIFFLDDDVMMPPDGLTFLMQAQDELLKNGDCDPCRKSIAEGKLPRHGSVTSGLYFAKKMLPDGKFHAKHTAMWHINKREPQLEMGYIDLESKGPNGQTLGGQPIEADFIGAGCMLVDSRVFQQTPEPWFKWNVGNDLNRKIKCTKCSEENFVFEHPAQRMPVSEDFYACLEWERILGVKPVVFTNVLCQHIATAKIDIDGMLTLVTR